MLCQHGAVMLVEKTSVVLTKCCIKRDDMVSLARYTVFCFEELLEQAHHAHDKLFSSTVCSNHCLHHLLQLDRSMFPMSLRPRGHFFDLPRFKYDLP